MEIRYELMRPQDIVAARARAAIAYLPIGPMEWHGPHMAVGMDMLHAHTMALEAARKAGGVVLPPLPLGTETYTDAERLRHRGFTGTERIYGMDYPGFALPSLYIEESAFALIVREVVRGLKRQAFKVIALVNGHGALNHRMTLMRVATETTEPGRATVLLAGYLYDGRYREHAAIGETSYLLAYHPEAIDLSALPALPTPLGYREFGILDRQTVVGEPTPDFTVAPEHDPRRATAEKGRDDVAYESDQIARRVTEALAALERR